MRATLKSVPVGHLVELEHRGRKYRGEVLSRNETFPAEAGGPGCLVQIGMGFEDLPLDTVCEDLGEPAESVMDYADYDE